MSAYDRTVCPVKVAERASESKSAEIHQRKAGARSNQVLDRERMQEEQRVHFSCRSDPVQCSEEDALFMRALDLLSFLLSFQTNSQMKMGDCLRTTNQCVPSLHERWVVFALMRDMERKTSAQGGQNSQATKAHDMSRTYLQQAYLLLSKENMDLDRIMLFLDKAIGFERDSRDVYQLLLRQYPNSAQVIRGYGALLRDIYRDDDTTMLMFTEANIIEEDTTLTETMSRVSGGSKLSSIAGRSSGQQKKKKNRNDSGATLQLDEDKTALLPLFIHIVIMSGIVIVGTMVAISSAGIHERDLHGQHQSHQQSVREESNHAPRGTGRSVPGSFGDALIFDDGIRRHPHHHPTQVVNMNLIDLVNNIANVAALIIINEGFWNTVEWPGLPAQLYFVIKNGPYVDIAVGGASVVHHLIVLIVQYVQTINKLKRERREVLF
ncbi:hypothetical protein BLNAU_4357 [Blattamonas nauphoetae]|uniref:TmcB/TmcC TPR repeats domain-containing protein n=1 Tax=Blattamonas nauphoetae TaxID=2049346 RepID=A0ABQ9YAA9_9EUKA|nr:hypothetical protein BLNAU_4357 [Blattamonas nauphoetae]